MRIAQVAPLTEAVPPKLYGGTERVVHWLTEELVALGNEVTLSEVRRGRVAFLEAVVDQLKLANVRVRLGRAEALSRRFDVCVARAFSSPAGTWQGAEPLLEPGGRLIYWAGARFEPSDLASLGVSWRVSTRSDLAHPGPLVIMGRQ